MEKAALFIDGCQDNRFKNIASLVAISLAGQTFHVEGVASQTRLPPLFIQLVHTYGV